MAGLLVTVNGPMHKPFLGTFERDSAQEWERQSGVLAVYEASPRPVWSVEPPTHEGWFWVRPDDRSFGIPVKVERAQPSGVLMWGSSEIPWRPVRAIKDLWWSNRSIPEPA